MRDKQATGKLNPEGGGGFNPRIKPAKSIRALAPEAGLPPISLEISSFSATCKAYFGRRYMLSASHRLHADSLTPEENRAAYGKCNNPHGHGHNYVVEVLVGGPVDPATGMVVDLAALDEVVRKRVTDRFDRTNLDLDPLFAKQVPTTENLCRAVFRLLKDELPAGELEYVRVEETENNFFQCYDAGEESPNS